MTDPLDELLRAEPYLDDKGFTQQVMQSLPARKSAAQGRGKVLLGFGLAAAGVFVAGSMSLSSVVAVAIAAAIGVGTAVSVALREAQG